MNPSGYLAWFLAATCLSSFLIALLRKTEAYRKVTSEPKRGGGVALAAAVLFLLGLVYWAGNAYGILPKDYWSILVAAIIVVVAGILDDRIDLLPYQQLIFQSAAALVLLFAGDSIDHIRIPFMGIVHFSPWIGNLASFLWILIVINSFNWLDGVDGLAGGIGFLGASILFLLSLTALVSQPQTAIMAVLLGGAILGFLFFNFHPAKIFLGSAGANFVGLMLATLSIYSGGKVATAFLVLGIPLVDFMWVSVVRLLHGKYPWQGGDRRHLHYRLQDAGWNPIKISLTLYLFCGIFGFAALSLQTGGKFVAGILLVAVFALFAAFVGREKLGAAFKRERG